MRLVDVQENGELELRWMWLPMFISQNGWAMQELQKELSVFLFRPLTVAILEEINTFVIDWLFKKFPDIRVKELLEAINKIEDI